MADRDDRGDEFRGLTSALVIERGTGPLGRVWRSGRPYSSEDAAHEPEYPRAGAAAREGLRGTLWLPIRSGTDVLGVIEFYSRRPNHLDDALLTTLATIGHQIGEYTRRRHAADRLAHQALQDDLTGLPNRGLLFDRLGHALARSTRFGSTVAVLFMDIDDFKLINDGLGHHIGDRLLVALSERLSRVLRTSDTIGRARETVARFGGDEFVVLCEDVGGEDDALRIAERLAEDLRRPAVVDGHEHEGRRRGRGDRGAARDPAPPRLRPGAGVPLRPAAPAGRARGVRAVSVAGAGLHPLAVELVQPALDLERLARLGMSSASVVASVWPSVSLTSARMIVTCCAFGGSV